MLVVVENRGIASTVPPVVVTLLVVAGETLSAELATGLIAVAESPGSADAVRVGVWAMASGASDRTSDKSPTSTPAMRSFMGISPSGTRILVQSAGCFKQKAGTNMRFLQ